MKIISAILVLLWTERQTWHGKENSGIFENIFRCLKFRDFLGGKNFVTINKPAR